MAEDYYQILGVGRDASAADIQKAYRKLARKYHPDVSKESHAEERFKELGEAYEVLKDPDKRAAYDRIASGRRHGERFTAPPDWDFGFDLGGGRFAGDDARGFSDFFETLFGRAGGRRSWRTADAAAPGLDRYACLAISLEDAYAGSSQTVTLTVPEIDGQGRVVNQTRSLSIRIPKGVKEGQRIRLPGQGGLSSRGGKVGDVYLEIRFRPHRIYRAEGSDVFLELPVTPWEAALGETVTVPTLAGPVELRIPAGSQSGRKLRLKGRGLPGKPPGDQYVTLKIVTPPAATAEARALYRKMAEVMPMDPRTRLLEI